jgi:hypothetical protein
MTEWTEGRTAPATDVIERWKAAYFAANGESPDGSMKYERGWFVFRHPYPQRFRRLQVLDMISRLEARLPTPPSSSTQG